MPAAARSSSSSSRSRVERHALGRRLHLDEPAVAGHHDVHVDVGGRVLGVVEVEQRLAVDDADRDGRDRAGERLREAEAVERALRRDVRAADRRAARAAVGLEHVAVEPDRPLAERLEVDDARAARGRSAAGSRPCARPACRATPRARVRSPVDAGSSEYSAVIQPRPRAVEPARHASSIDAVQSTFVLPCDQSTTPCGCSRKSSSSASGRSSSGAAAVGRAHAAASSSASVDVLDLADRQLEEARAQSRGRRPGRRSSGSGTSPSRAASFSIPCARASRRPRARSPRRRRRASRRARTRAGRSGRISG